MGFLLIIEKCIKIMCYIFEKCILEPNTEIKMTFEKDDEGNEYSWTDYMSYKEIDLYVKKIINE